MKTKTQPGDFIAIGFIEALVYQPAPHLSRFVLTFQGDSIIATHCKSGETIRFDNRTPALAIMARLDEEILDIMRDDDEALYNEPLDWPARIEDVFIDIDAYMMEVA